MHAVRLVRPRLPWGSWLMVVSDWRLHLWLSAMLRGVVPGFLADLVLPSVHGCGVSGRQVDACGSGLYSAWRPSSIEIPSFLCLVFSHAEQSMFCKHVLSVIFVSQSIITIIACIYDFTHPQTFGAPSVLSKDCTKYHGLQCV